MSTLHTHESSLDSYSPSGVSSRSSFAGKTSSFLHAKKLPALRASTTGTAAEMLINNIVPNASFQHIIKDRIDSQQQHTQHHHHHHHHHPLSRQNEEPEDEEQSEPKIKVPQTLFKVSWVANLDFDLCNNLFFDFAQKKIVGDLFGTSTTGESLAGLMYRSRIIEKDEKQIRCIDSNVEFFKYKAKEPNNYLKFKINNSAPYVSKHLNMSFSTDTVDVSNSSHCLPLYSDVQYFNILENGSIVLGDKTNYIFKIFKILDPNKVEIIFNNYLKENININKNDFLKGKIKSYKEFNENLNNLNNLYFQMTSVSKEYVYLKINSENSKYIYMNTYNITKPINERIKKAKFVDYSYNSKYIDSFDFKNFNSEGISKITFDNINYKEIRTNRT
jgi:hypothetical protein